MSEESLAQTLGSDPRKAALAKVLWNNTIVSQTWIARRLEMCSAANVGRILHKWDSQGLKLRLDNQIVKFIERKIAHPNFTNDHQLEDLVDGHIFISVLAFHLLSWVRQKFEAAGDTREWKTIRRLLSTHSLVSTWLPLSDGRTRPHPQSQRARPRAGASLQNPRRRLEKSIPHRQISF